MIFWIAQFRIHWLFSFLVIIISYKTTSGFVQVNFQNEKISSKSIKVMSYNCMLFDLYNWSKNKKSRKIILETLTEENPNILCLQEFYTSEQKGDFNNIDTLEQILTAKNNHIEYTTTLRGEDHWGVATFTKYPILKKGKIEFQNAHANNICIYTDVLIKKDTVRIYNMHLQSIRFNYADYHFINAVENDSLEADGKIENSKNILRRLKRAFVKRATQADVINLHISSCPYKVIVCGDFNDTPSSYVYYTIRGNLKDAFMEAGSGFAQTYAGKFPRFRIDYILHSRGFTSQKYYAVSETITDHYPIVTYLRINKKKDS